MSSSDYYWSHNLIKGFGKLWFLIIPQESDASGGGASLLGSVVKELNGDLLGLGIFGKDFPEPNHLTQPQLILKALESHRVELKLKDQKLIQEIKYPHLAAEFEKKKVLKTGISDFPGLPISFSIDYSLMEKISIKFGENTRKLFIPAGYLSRLKNFVGGDDSLLSSDINIDKEMIVHQILLTDQYKITFNSEKVFNPEFQTSINVANTINAGKVSFNIDQTSKSSLTVDVHDGKEYLIAIKNIDWDDF